MAKIHPVLGRLLMVGLGVAERALESGAESLLDDVEDFGQEVVARATKAKSRLRKRKRRPPGRARDVRSNDDDDT